MMRLLKTMRKNLLLLIRSRLSAFVILIGPLLIILLIGLVFSTPPATNVSLGVEKNDAPLAIRFIDNMKEAGFIVDEFSDISLCIDRIEIGDMQTCILFPDDFVIANNKTNVVTFYVDDSRTNYVYQIIDKVGSSIGVESTELSKDLTNDILTLLWSTHEGIDQSIAMTIALKADSSSSKSAIGTSSADLETVDFSFDVPKTKKVEDLYDDYGSETNTLKGKAQTLSTKANEIAAALDAAAIIGVETEQTALVSASDAFSSALTDFNEEASDIDDDFEDALGVLDDALKDVSSKLDDAMDKQTSVSSSLMSIQTDIDEMSADLDALKSHLEELNKNIVDLKITSGDTISQPIVTLIEPVSSANNRLLYFFPYLLLLVVLLIGLLLPATLIVMEKRSKSSFRTFCTPTSDKVFMSAHFLTSFVVIAAQVVIVLGLAYYFLGTFIAGNIIASLLVLILAIILFILLGMALGYLFNTQEAVTIVSISVGSLFIFLSNLVLPLETLAPQFVKYIGYNPYVMTSELMRRALLFGANVTDLQNELIVLFGIAMIILVLMILIKNAMKSRYRMHLAFMNKSTLQKPSDTYLHIGKTEIKDLNELLDWLKSVDEKTYHKDLPWRKLRKWLGNSKRLRLMLAGKKREKAIEILEKHLKKDE